MTTQWIPVPSVPPLTTRTTPLLIDRHQVGSVQDDLIRFGAVVREISLGDTVMTADVTSALREVLVFPSWCGSGWDSFDDAFEEIRSASQFPLFVFADGLQELIEKHSHVALETVVRLAEAERAFSLASVQFVVIYVGEGWST